GNTPDPVPVALSVSPSPAALSPLDVLFPADPAALRVRGGTRRALSRLGEHLQRGEAGSGDLRSRPLGDDRQPRAALAQVAGGQRFSGAPHGSSLSRPVSRGAQDSGK